MYTYIVCDLHLAIISNDGSVVCRQKAIRTKGDMDILSPGNKVTPLSGYAEIFDNQDIACHSGKPIVKVQVISGSINMRNC